MVIKKLTFVVHFKKPIPCELIPKSVHVIDINRFRYCRGYDRADCIRRLKLSGHGDININYIYHNFSDYIISQLSHEPITQIMLNARHQSSWLLMYPSPIYAY